MYAKSNKQNGFFYSVFPRPYVGVSHATNCRSSLVSEPEARYLAFPSPGHHYMSGGYRHYTLFLSMKPPNHTSNFLKTKLVCSRYIPLFGSQSSIGKTLTLLFQEGVAQHFAALLSNNIPPMKSTESATTFCFKISSRA